MRKVIALAGIMLLSGCSSQVGLLAPDQIGLASEQTKYTSFNEFSLVDNVSPDCSGPIRKLEQELRDKSVFIEGQNLSKAEGAEDGGWLVSQYIYEFPTSEESSEFASRLGGAILECDQRPETQDAPELLGSSDGVAWKSTATSAFLGVDVTINRADAIAAKDNRLIFVQAFAEENALSLAEVERVVSKALGN